jgi:molybdopterin converting factor subunit 1
VTVNVLYFAASRDAAGTPRETVALPSADADASSPPTTTPATTDTLLDALVERHPALEPVLRSCVLALNQEYVARGEGRALRDGDEVAVVPPLSGG